MNAPAHLRKIDGWNLLTVRDSDGFPGKTLSYSRPEINDVARIFVPAGMPIERRKVAENLQKLLDRGPPNPATTNGTGATA